MMKRSAIVFFIFFFAGTSAYAERPLETEGSDVIGNGRVAVEVGVEYLENRKLPFDTSRVDREQFALPSLGLAVGVGDRAEIQVDFDVFYMDETGADDTYDVGDLELWTKLEVLENNEDHPGLGLRFGVKLPNASNESRLGTDETDFLGHLILSEDIGALEANVNVGIGILGNPNQNNSQDDVLTYGASLLFPVTDAVTVFGEVFGWGTSSEDNDYSTARGGFLIHAGENLVFDVSGRAGLTDESEDWGVGTGVTWAFEAFN